MSRKIATIDAETDPFSHGNIPSPFIWGYYDGEQYLEFTETTVLAKFLAERDEVVYAHNGGKFDFHFLVEHFNTFEPLLVINNRIASVKIGKCELRDSYSILPVPLADMEKDAFDYSKMERGNRAAHMSEIKRYLHNDCVYLYNHVAEFIENYGRKITLASTAMSIWSKMSGEPLPASDRDYYDTMRPYYYGGRVECFTKGVIKKPFTMYDINSAYPDAMKRAHPYSLEYIIGTSECKTIIGADFYDVTASSIGALPYIDDTGFNFPADDQARDFRVTGWELQAGVDNGLIIYNCARHIHFRGLRDFAPYVDHFYAIKNTAPKDSSDRLFAKLMLNSLYGKFGANPDKYKERMIVPIAMGFDGAENGWDFSAQIGDKAIIAKDLDDANRRYYNVATAASITGFVRAYLFRSIKNSGEVIYCDTDSIACHGHFAGNISDNLGDWDIDGTFTSGAIAGKKMYAFKYSDNSGYKTASKGVNISAKEIIKVANGGTVEYKNQAPTFSLGKETRFISREVRKT